MTTRLRLREALRIIAKTRGFTRGRTLVIRDGKAYFKPEPEPIRTSHKGSSNDLLEAASLGRTFKLKRIKPPKKPKP